MTKSSLKTLASLLLLIGIVAGLGLYYTGIAWDAKTFNPEAILPHDCPAYPGTSELFRSDYDGNIDINIPRSDEEAGASTRVNFIDDEIFGRMERAVPPIQPAPRATDEEFVRRIYIDLTGRIPTADEAATFLDDGRPNKRALLIDTLLNSPECEERLTFFFGELLRNTGRRLFNPGRNMYYGYIRQSVHDMIQETNPAPYTTFVREMITATGETAGNGPVNFLARAWLPGASQADFRDDLAIQVGKVFLGTPFECISCHNGARHLEDINLGLVSKLRRDLWGMAAFFSTLTWSETYPGVTYKIDESGSPGYRTDNGGYRPPRTPSGPVTTIFPKYIMTDQTVDVESNFREELVRMLTADPQFAKAAVNYLWAEFMGRGIVDPPNAFDHARQDPLNPPPAPWTVQPSHPALLNQLAAEFQSSNFSLRRIIQLITNSSAYQLSATYRGQWQARYTPYFARHILRRYSAEQLHDAIVKATGVPPNPGANPGYDTGLGYRVPFAIQIQEPGMLGGAAGNIMGVFQAGNRDDADRSTRGSVLQTMYLLNNRDFLYPRIRAAENNNNLVRRLLNDPDLSGPDHYGDIVDILFLATLSRRPTDTERDVAIARMNLDRVRGAEDTHFALLNMMEFLYH